MGAPETIRIFKVNHNLADITKYILNISILFLVIQSIFTVLEPYINKKENFQAAFQS